MTKGRIPVNAPEKTELRKWCIEQAIKWPFVMIGGWGQVMSGPGKEPIIEDQDLIGRANKILAWVEDL